MPVSIATSREDIYQALFDKIKEATFAQPILGKYSWMGSVRKYVDPAQMTDQPFLSQFEGFPESYEQGGNRLPPIRVLGVRLFCWARVNSGDPLELGTQYVTWMLEAVERALAPEQVGYGTPGLQTLGGLVQWCRIEGAILKFPGDTDPQALVSIPIKILWP